MGSDVNDMKRASDNWLETEERESQIMKCRLGKNEKKHEKKMAKGNRA